MKLNSKYKLGAEYNRNTLEPVIQEIEQKVNAIGEGLQEGTHNAYTAAPTTGDHAIGDFVLNSNPSEAGGAGAKYIIHGWRCTASGTPGTWLECRFLTGN
jgi:hypothetical protein